MSSVISTGYLVTVCAATMPTSFKYMILLLRLFAGLSLGCLALLLTFYRNHVPWSVSYQSVSESSHIKLLWGFNVYTDHVLSVQCLDIVVVNKEIASVQIIDVAVPADCNVTSRRLKSGKYRNLSIELSLWKMKYEITPIVVGCLGCVTHVLKSNLKKLSVFD